ncbi:Dynein intermediate chain 3 [Diplonema papillatum]|nr:Dynein intermediate chain 3 [Diplonema papillatum]|eukprot:gene12029-18579_t
MADITYTYTQSLPLPPKRRHFSDAGPYTLCAVQPDAALKRKYCRQDPCECEVDNVRKVRNAESNTAHVAAMARGMTHVEGGWPMVVVDGENEARWKHVKKIEREEAYATSVAKLAASMSRRLKENNAIDCYENYAFPTRPGQQPTDSCIHLQTPSVSCLQIISIMENDRGSVSQTSWASPERLAVAIRCPLSSELVPCESQVWDISRPLQPAASLLPRKGWLSSVAFAPKECNVVAGGGVDGTVQWWDIRTGPKPAVHSGQSDSHSDEVCSIRWLTAKSGEALSTSLDGTVRVWDMRNLSAPLPPTAILRLTGGKGKQHTLAGVCLEYDPLIGGPSRFLVGTQEGIVVNSFLGLRTAEIVDQVAAHHGPVYSVARYPGHASVFLTTGDWRSCIFADGGKEAIWATPYCEALATASAWQPKRNALFFRSRSDGVVEAWDLLQDLHAPSLSAKISKTCLTAMSLGVDGSLLAAGDARGNLYIAKLEAWLFDEARSGRSGDDINWAEMAEAERAVSVASSEGSGSGSFGWLHDASNFEEPREAMQDYERSVQEALNSADFG